MDSPYWVKRREQERKEKSESNDKASNVHIANKELSK